LNAARLAQLGPALVLVLALAGSSAGAAPSRSRNVYVANEAGGISQYDVGAGGLLASKTPAQVPAGSFLAQGIAMSPDGGSLYVPDVSSNSVFQYDVAANGALTPKAPPTVAAGTSPHGIAVSPDGSSVYVANTDDDTVSEFDVGAGGLLTPKPIPSAPTGVDPTGVAVSPDGKSVYVANLNGPSVSEYDVGPLGVLFAKATPSVPAEHGAWAVAVSPDSKSVYVTNWGGGGVSQYDAGADGSLSPKSVPFVATTTDVPMGIAVSPDGRSVYVAEQGNAGSGPRGDIYAFDASSSGALSPKATPSYSVFFQHAQGVAVTPDDQSLYAVTREGQVFEFTIGPGGALTRKQTGATPGTIAAGSGPINVVARPDAGPVAAFTVATSPPVRAGSQAHFFAGSSTDADGSIAAYDWSFGDGTTGAGLQGVHTYSAPGTYTVTLRVTDDSGCSSTVVATGQTVYCPSNPAAETTQSVTVAPPLPALLGLHVSPKAFRGRKGTLIIYRDLRAATTFFTFSRTQRGYRSHGRCVARKPAHTSGRCVRTTPLKGQFTHRDRSGANRVPFNARLRGKALPPGSYVLHAVPRVGSERGKQVTTAFRIRG
jgi:DNA-binding beta-propeller fold protein YncE